MNGWTSGAGSPTSCPLGRWGCLRQVYGKAGMHVAGAIVTTPSAIIDHKLYWGTVNTLAEGLYICAILNCPELTELVRPFKSYGKDERDIDKLVWKLPIPIYAPTPATTAGLGARAKGLLSLIAAAVTLP